MKRLICLTILALFTLAAVGCSSCGQKEASAPMSQTFATGFAGPELLADAYLEAIEKKDPQLLKKLFLTPDDMDKVKRGNNRQLWQAYFMISKRSFMDKNKSYLGQKLEKVDFRLGRQLDPVQGFNIYRGSVVRFKLPGGQLVTGEINFLIEANDTWKIFGLKYIAEELQRRGLAEQMGLFPGEAKFKGVDKVHDMNLKVRRLTPTPAPDQPAPATP